MAMATGSKGPMATINVTPMVDVMLVLLIIFIVITPMLTKGVSVDRVKARNPSSMAPADKDDAVVVAVSKDGKVFLGKTMMKAEELGPKVKDMITNKLDKMVYVNSDSRAKYGLIVEVVDNIRTAGVDQIGLLTEKIEEGARTATPAQ
jgi:biopolymer transport protein ExbD/biopolymer transport protein TolR